MLQRLGLIRNLIILFCLIFLAGVYLALGPLPRATDIRYGATFSIKQARDLGLNWQETYTAALDDLKIKRFRIPAYWDELEKQDGTYDWTNLDWQIDEAAKRNAQIILAVGGRLPRWPECHYPGWAMKDTVAVRQQKNLDYLKTVIEHYRGKSNIMAWQIENEPFLPNFGECPPFDASFLDTEISLVKMLDGRPIVVTDSGELSVWVRAADRADIFGTSIYRDTYSKLLQRYVHYPITPAFFKIKKNLANIFAHPSRWVVIELQAEPWCKESYQDVSQAERDRTMSPEKFKEMLTFIQGTGFDEFYLWGVEWWYWEKTQHNRPVFWQTAKEVLANSK